MSTLRSPSVLDVNRGHEGDQLNNFAKGGSNKIVAGRADMPGDAKGVAISNVARDKGLAIPVLQASLRGERGEGEGPSVPNGRIGPNPVRRGNEERVGIGRAVCEANQQTAGQCLDNPLCPTFPFIKKGEVEELEEVGEFGDDEDVVDEDLSGVREGLDDYSKAPSPVNKTLERSLIDVGGGDQAPKKDAEVDGLKRGFDSGPGASSYGLGQRGREDGGNKIGLVNVYTKTRGVAKEINQSHRLPELEIVASGDREVIGAGPRLHTRESVDPAEENVIADDKENGGERATLLDTSVNVNPDIRGTPDSRTNLDSVEQASD